MADETRTNPPWGTFPLSTRQAMLLGLYRLAPVGRRKLKSAALRALQGEQQARYDIEVAGIRTRCHLGDNASERKLLLNGRRKDREQLRQILAHLRPGGVFVDIGANVGLYSLRAARAVGSAGRVIAIEPNPAMAGRLRFNIIANNLRNVIVEEAAIGADTGTATLRFDPAKQGAGSLAEGPSGAAQVVKVVPLATILAKRGIKRIDALKIDVEGYEDRALLPFFETAERSLWPRMILMEVSWRNRWHEDCVAKLAACGYHQVWQGRDDLAFVLEGA